MDLVFLCAHTPIFPKKYNKFEASIRKETTPGDYTYNLKNFGICKL